MTANRNAILAGVAGGGAAGTTLANFAPEGTTLPTSATGAGATLDAAFLDPGWITQEGLVKNVNESSTDINAYGTTSPVRTLITASKVTFALTFLESNPVSTAIYNRLALNSITVNPTDGSFDLTEGAPRVQYYSAVFDMVDGLNHLRAVVPQVQVTDRGQFAIAAGSAITYNTTLTAFPGSDGVAVHWFYVVDALKP